MNGYSLEYHRRNALGSSCRVSDLRTRSVGFVYDLRLRMEDSGVFGGTVRFDPVGRDPIFVRIFVHIATFILVLIVR